MSAWFDRIAVTVARRGVTRRTNLSGATDDAAPAGRLEPRLERLERRLAGAISRRQALIWLGGTAAAATVLEGGLWPGSARAASCQTGLTDCGSPESHLDCCTPSQSCCTIARGGFCYDPATSYCDGECGPLGFEAKCSARSPPTRSPLGRARRATRAAPTQWARSSAARVRPNRCVELSAATPTTRAIR
jgi:hypothetical protein